MLQSRDYNGRGGYGGRGGYYEGSMVGNSVDQRSGGDAGTGFRAAGTRGVGEIAGGAIGARGNPRLPHVDSTGATAGTLAGGGEDRSDGEQLGMGGRREGGGDVTPWQQRFSDSTHSGPEARLQTNISQPELYPVLLDVIRYNEEAQLTAAKAGLEPPKASRGPACPVFEFGFERFPGIGSCWEAGIADEKRAATRPPVNCKGVDPTCIQKNDLLPHNKWSAQVLVLRNVYINVVGQVFNSTHIFDHNACAGSPNITVTLPFRYAANRTRVTHFKELVSLVDWFAWSTRAMLLDLIPLFISLHRILPAMRGVPVAVGHRRPHVRNGLEQLCSLGAVDVLGVQVDKMNVHVVKAKDLFFAEKLVIPLHQRCGEPSRSLWHYLRMRHLLPPGGLPIFNAGGMGGAKVSDSGSEDEVFALKVFTACVSFTTTSHMRAIPPDWTSRFKGSATPAYTPHAYAPGSNWVVLLGWKEQRASLLQSLKLHEHLTRLFPPERVVIYREGSISLPRRKDLLNRALLMVSVHDNILADIVFMPPGSAVLEIRPVENPDVIFHQLADICEIEYYLAFCEGGKAVGSAAGGWAGKPVEGNLVAKDPKGVQKMLTDISRKVFARANAMRRKGG
ncbi:unnamed protein product [Closterium sp. Yama58-4]|nr:unnamed protein product [Closterium sp. Yama58-4]